MMPYQQQALDSTAQVVVLHFARAVGKTYTLAQIANTTPCVVYAILPHSYELLRQLSATHIHLTNPRHMLMQMAEHPDLIETLPPVVVIDNVDLTTDNIPVFLTHYAAGHRIYISCTDISNWRRWLYKDDQPKQGVEIIRATVHDTPYIPETIRQLLIQQGADQPL